MIKTFALLESELETIAVALAYRIFSLPYDENVAEWELSATLGIYGNVVKKIEDWGYERDTRTPA